MKLLLDTHIALWVVWAPEKLSPKAIAYLTAPNTEAAVSVVSIAEIAIKYALGKKRLGSLPVSAEQAVSRFAEAGFSSLAFTEMHAAAMEKLPPIHKDPFDRMLVAQALSEPLVLLTHDGLVGRYSKSVIIV